MELIPQSAAPVEQLQDAVGQVIAARLKSGKFLYVDSGLKIDLPEARVVIDRSGWRTRGGPGRRGPGAGTLLGGAYVNRSTTSIAATR